MEGQIDYYVPTAPPQEEVQSYQIQYIQTYPNEYIYDNNLEIERQIIIQKTENEIRIQKMENEILQEREIKNIWKNFCLCFSCLFCCCLTL